MPLTHRQKFFVFMGFGKELPCRYVLVLFYREHTITTFKELDSDVRSLFWFCPVVPF